MYNLRIKLGILIALFLLKFLFLWNIRISPHVLVILSFCVLIVAFSFPKVRKSAVTRRALYKNGKNPYGVTWENIRSASENEEDQKKDLSKFLIELVIMIVLVDAMGFLKFELSFSYLKIILSDSVIVGFFYTFQKLLIEFALQTIQKNLLGV